MVKYDCSEKSRQEIFGLWKGYADNISQLFLKDESIAAFHFLRTNDPTRYRAFIDLCQEQFEECRLDLLMWRTGKQCPECIAKQLGCSKEECDAMQNLQAELYNYLDKQLSYIYNRIQMDPACSSDNAHSSLISIGSQRMNFGDDVSSLLNKIKDLGATENIMSATLTVPIRDTAKRLSTVMDMCIKQLTEYRNVQLDKSFAKKQEEAQSISLQKPKESVAVQLKKSEEHAAVASDSKYTSLRTSVFS